MSSAPKDPPAPVSLFSDLLAFQKVDPKGYGDRRQSLSREMTDLQAKMADLRRQYDAKALMFECLQLLEQATNSVQSDRTLEILQPAMAEWRKTLVPPEKWSEESDVPYTETDEYGDVAALEEAVDVLLDWVADLYENNDKESTVGALLSIAVHFHQCAEVVTKEVAPNPPSADLDEILDEISGKWEELIPELRDEMFKIAGIAAWKDLFLLHLASPFDGLAQMLKE